MPGGMQNRLHLLARRIVVPHPRGGIIDATAPLPPHMLQSWNLLGLDAKRFDPIEDAPERVGESARRRPRNRWLEEEIHIESLRMMGPGGRRGASASPLVFCSGERSHDLGGGSPPMRARRHARVSRRYWRPAPAP